MERELQSLPVHLGPTAAWDPSVAEKVGTLQTDRQCSGESSGKAAEAGRAVTAEGFRAKPKPPLGSLKPCHPTLRFQDPKAL